MRVFLLTCLAFVLGGCDSSPPPVAPDAATGTVTIRILAPDSEPQIFELESVAEGETVESVMRDLDAVPVVITGSGSTAFVDSIAGVSTGATEGWTFKVNGEFSPNGIGQTTLSPPTEVVWTFGEFGGP